MNTKLVNTAAGVINAALAKDRTAAGIALALESAQLLMSPETTAELERLHREAESNRVNGQRLIRAEQRTAELEAVLGTHRKDDRAEIARLTARVDQLLAERATTNGALVDVTVAQRAAEGRSVDQDPITFALTPAADDVAPLQVTRSVEKLRTLLAGQREQAGGAA